MVVESNSLNSHNCIKFLCSYGGRILPRHPDGKLRYHGGETRLLSVYGSISFAELLEKMSELYGSSVSLRCQLPTEDLDSLISITSDEDLANLIEEYDRAAAGAKPSPAALQIRAFLSAPKTVKKVSPPPSLAASGGIPPRCASSRHASRPPAYPIASKKVAGRNPHQYAYQSINGGYVYVIHNGNQWQ